MLIEFGARNGLLDGFVAWIESTRVATYISENSYAFPWLSASTSWRSASSSGSSRSSICG